VSGSQVLGPGVLSEDELVRWGGRIGTAVEPPLWIALNGPLGAGKSVLARAICRGAGVIGHIPSPSFTLVQAYASPRGFSIHHVDLFRLEPGDPLEPLGWDDLLGTTGLVLVEWADRAAGQQPDDRWDVEIEHGAQLDERIVRVSRQGSAPELVDW
jgi:tRNA threonylcarbamoyladenosine biosynthesis protein TsaE